MQWHKNAAINIYKYARGSYEGFTVYTVHMYNIEYMQNIYRI